MNPERTARRIVAERSGLACEGCDRARASDWAHRLSRSHGGLWCPANGLALCRDCHQWQRRPGQADAARDAGWVLLTGQDPELVPAWLALRGWTWLRPDGSALPARRAA